MRIIRFEDNDGQVHHGIEREGHEAEIIDGHLFPAPRPGGRTATIRRLLAPIRPVNIFCIGLNYHEHAAESGSEVGDYPVVFMKPTTAVLDPGAPIQIPKCQMKGPEVDYEVELAAVIGRAARDVTEEEALSYVIGYTCANDVSARRWQKHAGGGQWIRGKGFDTFCPLGPAIVTADEIPDPQALTLKTVLNGDTMQDSRTSDMIWSVAAIVSYLSRDVTLLPGTLILTGTPPGVGFARNPPVYLQPGDEVSVEIERIGRLTNGVAFNG